MNDDCIKTIEEYICYRDEGGYNIYELMKKLLLFEICYQTINDKIINENISETILESDLLQNFFKIGYLYVQVNILGKLFDRNSRTLSFINLWKKTKNTLPQNDAYIEIETFFNNINENEHFKTIKMLRDKIICHNDNNANRNVVVDIEQFVNQAFKVYGYFNSFIRNKFDFLDICDEEFLKRELEKLSLPFFKEEKSKLDFIKNYEKTLKRFNLKIFLFADKLKLMNETVKIEIITESIK